MFDSSRMYDQAERLFAQSRQFSSSAAAIFGPKKKRAIEGSSSQGKSNAAEAVPVAVEQQPAPLNPEELVPLGSNYPLLFDIFGESLFPFLTHRKDDFASTLFV